MTLSIVFFLTAIAVLFILIPLAKSGTVSGIVVPSHMITAKRIVAIIALVFIPLFSLSLYFYLGAPYYEAQPLSARMNKPIEEMDFAALVSKAEMQVKQNPSDVQGWALLAQIYQSQNRMEDAANAFRQILKLKPENEIALSRLGVILFTLNKSAQGEAETVFSALLKLQPKNPEARFFLAKAMIEKGQSAEAKKSLQTLLLEAPKNAPWAKLVEIEIKALEKKQ